MDDTQQVAQPTTTDSGQNQTVPTMGDLAGMVPQAPTMPGGMPMGDQSVTGMTPPPAVEPSMPSNPMSSSSMPTDSMAATMPVATMPEPVAMPQPSQPAMPVNTMSAADPEPAVPAGKGSATENGDDYSYAEDILSEILDSLDRIEAKLEAMEKKTA